MTTTERETVRRARWILSQERGLSALFWLLLALGVLGR
jgi:hypothetical protein